MMSAPLAARADIMSRMQSSIQLQTNSAATQVSRIGSTYCCFWIWSNMDIGGGNSADGKVGGLGTLTDGVGQGSIATATNRQVLVGLLLLANHYIEGDAIVTTAPSLGAVSAYSDQTSTAVGTGTGGRYWYCDQCSCCNCSWWRIRYCNYRSVRN